MKRFYLFAGAAAVGEGEVPLFPFAVWEERWAREAEVSTAAHPPRTRGVARPPAFRVRVVGFPVLPVAH